AGRGQGRRPAAGRRSPGSNRTGGNGTEQATRRKSVTYFVTGEEQTAIENQLTVRQILTAAGFTPVEQYRLTRAEGDHVYRDDAPEVPLWEGAPLPPPPLGPTPTS